MTAGIQSTEALAARLIQPGCHFIRGGNHSFSLLDPGYAWLILEGHADLFTTRLQEDQPGGSRFYFFSAQKGELLFGLPESKDNFGRALIAVPSLDADIVRIDARVLGEVWKEPAFAQLLNDLLDVWIGRLSLSLSRDIHPRTDLLIEPGEALSLKPNLKIRSAKGIAWIQLQKGNALFLGMKEVVEPGEPSLFPVSQDSWLQTTEGAALRVLSTSEVTQRPDFVECLRHFYDLVFFCEFLNIRFATVDEYNRLNERAASRRQTRRGALLKIALVINDTLRKTSLEPGQDPMLTACRLVAQSSGLRITEPKSVRGGEIPRWTLYDILRSSRFRSRAVRLEGNWWQCDNGPLLAFTASGHSPVALVPRSPGRYEYVNPADPVRRPLTAGLAKTLSPEAHQFYRPLPDHPVTTKELIRFGLQNCGNDLARIILIGLTGGLLNLLLPLLTGVVFDRVIPHGDFRQLQVYSLVIFFSISAVAFTEVLRRFAMIRIETKLDFSLQAAIWDRLLNLPAPFFRNYQAGELASKANSIMMLRKILSDTVIYTVLGSLFLMFNLFLLFFYNGLIAVCTTGMLTAAVLVIVFFGRSIRNHQHQIIHHQQKISGMLFQFLSSISKIRIAGAEIHAFAEWAGSFSHNKRQTYEVRKQFLKISLMSSVLPSLITLMVFGLIARQIPDAMSTGEFMAFITALTLTVASFLQLGMAAVSWFMASPMLESIRPILEATPENIALKPEIGELTGEIEVVNVSFRYSPDHPLVLDNVSMHLRPGEFVAVVGASGSGKSTLLRLLLGFESPETGSVYYDRQEITSFDPSSVRRQAGTVLQQSQLSAGNILNNITGMTTASAEDAWKAARAVGLDEDIRQMPMGMQTVITGGISTLSGGQRQRILIARAIVNNPRILFFDEATSALDNKTQQTVSRSLEQLQATRLVIAHRLSTVQNADRIYLMEQGRIEETGTYQELLDNGGKFTELVRRQMVE